MSSNLFRIRDHKLECQHIRQFARATATSQEEVLHLAIKQYTPLDNLHPKAGDITIIAAHANGFPKELYEPLWDELLARSKKSNFRIRSIWIADVAHQGWSGVLNEQKLGNDPSWFDHSRDLLHMINQFRKDMPRPLIGIGHSMGGCQLVQLSLMHPRLLETLVLIDPVIQRFTSTQGNFAPARASAFRRDRWSSRKAAAESMKRSKFYQTWDPRVFDRWIKYGLRDIPTLHYPESKATPGAVPATTTTEPTLTPSPPKEKEVTLTTTKHQEVFTFLRPNFAPLPSSSGILEPSTHAYTETNPTLNRRTHPDITPWAHPQTPFYRGESLQTFAQLPHLRPSVLYIFGEDSHLSAPEFREDKMAVTGVGVGGSGGAKEGKVKEVLVRGTGHLIPMEKVGKTADEVIKWVAGEMERWRVWEEADQREWEGLRTVRERSELGERYLRELKGDGEAKVRKPTVEKL